MYLTFSLQAALLNSEEKPLETLFCHQCKSILGQTVNFNKPIALLGINNVSVIKSVLWSGSYWQLLIFLANVEGSLIHLFPP